MTARPEVKERTQGLTDPFAGAASGNLPVPLGERILMDAYDKPIDLEANLKRYAKNREILYAFIREHLEEATYDSKGDLIPGDLNDYYKVPGAKTKALTKKGGEKIAMVFRWAKGPATIVNITQTQEYCSATINASIVDHYGRIVGNASSACSTAEPGFRSWGARKKYGATFTPYKQGEQSKELTPPDYRAALNDIVARASKRAGNQAIIFAAGLDEIFHDANDVNEKVTETKGAAEKATSPATFPLPFDSFEYKQSEGKKGFKHGTPLGEIDAANLLHFREWCERTGKRPELLEAIKELEETRRADGDDTP